MRAGLCASAACDRDLEPPILARRAPVPTGLAGRPRARRWLLARTLLLQTPLLLHADFIDYPTFAGAGLWQAAGTLRDAGHEVTLHDAFCLPDAGLTLQREGRIRLGTPWQRYEAGLPAQAPEVVILGNNPWLRARIAASELAGFVARLKARWPRAALVLADCDVGGMHHIAWGEAELDELGIAWGQRYEAEGGLAELVATLAAGREPPARICDGIPSSPTLDGLSAPAWDLVDLPGFWRFLERVGRAGHKREFFTLGAGVLPLKTSRGCAYDCSFCTSNPWTRTGARRAGWRPLGRERLHQALAHMAGALGANRVVVLDELVNVQAAHFDALLDGLEAQGLRADFPNGMRADRLTEAQVQRLAGLTDRLSISAEAATERVANELIGKRFDLEATEKVARWCRQAGLPLFVHWMIGHPRETRAEILQTLKTAWDLLERFEAWPLLQFATPILGTRLHEEVTRDGLWSAREDRDIGPLFQGRPAFDGHDWKARDLQLAVKAFEIKLASRQPRKVILNTTYICNNQCVFCATGNRLPTHGDPEEQLAFMRERRAQGFDLIDFDGGEPTTNPNLLRLLKAARDMGYRQLNLTTNGRMLAVPRNAEKIVGSPITSLLVSLHGPDEATHEVQVQSKGAFAQTVRGIANARPLCDRAGKRFGVNVTLTRTNFPVLMDYGDLLVRLGVKNCNIQFVTPFGRASAATQPDPQEVAPAVMALIDRFGDRIAFQVINLPLCTMPGYEQYCIGDLYKLERRMCFVSMEDVNLFDYLQSRRRHEAPCQDCLLSIACDGFYYFPDEWKDEAATRWGD